MLTLMPLSGIQSALRRKNSKNYDFSRRGSLSVYSTYSLPTSKNSLRRFSSYEGLAPIFQQFLAQQQSDPLENSSPVPSPSPSPPPPPPPPVEKRKRRASFNLGKRFRRLSGINLTSDTAATLEDDSNSNNQKHSVDELDNLFAKIREQLAQLKNEDIEICQRVDDLHTSVGDLYRERNVERQDMFTTSLTTPLTATLSPTAKEKVSSKPPVTSTTTATDSHSSLRRQSTTMPPNLSSKSLSVIRESSFEILDDDLSADDDSSSSDDEQSFEDYCRMNIPKLGASHTKRQPISFSALDDVDLPAKHFDPKQYCLPNNLELRPTSRSAPQLQLIKNDLSDSSSSDCDSNQRWSVISVQSDSVLVTNKRHSSHPNQPFEL